MQNKCKTNTKQIQNRCKPKCKPNANQNANHKSALDWIGLEYVIVLRGPYIEFIYTCLHILLKESGCDNYLINLLNLTKNCYVGVSTFDQ